ncbi:MAG: LysR family transcriptional regulator [Planctomycetota bacterium]
MEWLNYHHLLYFWTVAKEGSLGAASRLLGIGRPAISMQVRELEKSLGHVLFERVGRRLELTEMGRVAFEHAEAIFQTGQDLLDHARGRAAHRPARLRAGVADVVQKVVAFRFFEPALRRSESVVLSCREGPVDDLFGDLLQHRLDIVIADRAPLPSSSPRMQAHLLGTPRVAWYGQPELNSKLRRGFPSSLNGAPVLLPPAGSGLRQALDQWFTEHALRPDVVGVFEDSALLKHFARAGFGIFPAPRSVSRDILTHTGARILATLDDVRESFFAVVPARRHPIPVVEHLLEKAGKWLRDGVGKK